MVEHRVGWADPLAVGLTLVGYAGLVWIALAAVAALRAGARPLVAAAVAAACVWSADLIAAAIKAIVDRPRPSAADLGGADALGPATVGSSMPSGHAATAFAGALAVAALWRGRRGRSAPLLLLLLAVAIAGSRVYLGRHWPSDVLVGAALGAGVALAAIGLLRAGMSRWGGGGRPATRTGRPGPRASPRRGG